MSIRSLNNSKFQLYLLLTLLRDSIQLYNFFINTLRLKYSSLNEQKSKRRQSVYKENAR